jgi:hypothetical protein
MASAYDEIKKVLAMLRQGELMSEQNRSELNRVRTMLEQQFATDDLVGNEMPPAMRQSRDPAKTLLAREVSES